jgi:pilus assembly protein Flp/PilA
MFAKFFKDESGATAIEYAMVAGGIALGLVALIPKIGSSVKIDARRCADRRVIGINRSQRPREPDGLGRYQPL